MVVFVVPFDVLEPEEGAVVLDVVVLDVTVVVPLDVLFEYVVEFEEELLAVVFVGNTWTWLILSEIVQERSSKNAITDSFILNIFEIIEIIRNKRLYR